MSFFEHDKKPDDKDFPAHHVPGQFLIIYQYSHQFRDGHCRMSVIQLYSNLNKTDKDFKLNIEVLLFSIINMNKSHQIWHKLSWMFSTVQCVNMKQRAPGLSYLIWQCGQIHAHHLSWAKLGGFESADNVLESRSHHKILLLQTQLFPLKELTYTNSRICLHLGSKSHEFCFLIWNHLSGPELHSHCH